MQGHFFVNKDIRTVNQNIIKKTKPGTGEKKNKKKHGAHISTLEYDNDSSFFFFSFFYVTGLVSGIRIRLNVVIIRDGVPQVKELACLPRNIKSTKNAPRFSVRVLMTLKKVTRIT